MQVVQMLTHVKDCVRVRVLLLVVVVGGGTHLTSGVDKRR
jgi:hypothetical protein